MRIRINYNLAKYACYGYSGVLAKPLEKASAHRTCRTVRGFEPGEQAVCVVFVLAGRTSPAR